MSKEHIKNEHEKSEYDSEETLFEKPIPLQREMVPSDPYPVGALGNILASVVQVFMDVIQAPDGICAQSVLAAVALAVQGHANVIIDGREYPLSEFFLTIGASGERKSTVDTLALQGHRVYQDRLRHEYEKLFLNWKALTEAYEAAKKDFFKVNKSYQDKAGVIEAIGYPPPQPLDPLILTEEPTFEGLTKLLMIGQPSVGLFSDEGGRFVGGHGMNDDNLLKTAAGMSMLWDGKPTSRVRASDQNALLCGKRVSFHLMAQPNVAQILLSNRVLIGQGMISRCLISSPQSTAGSRLYKEIDISMMDEYKTYLSKISEIMNIPPPLRAEKQNELTPRNIPLSPEAKYLYVEFHNNVENKIGENGQFHTIRGFANKAPEHAVRLAGIISLFGDIHTNEISYHEMESGILLAKYYLNETLRLHNSSYLDPELELAQKLLNWLCGHQKSLITLSEISQFGPSQIRNAKTARKLMGILTDHYWAEQINGGHIIDGSHRKEAWRVRI